MNTLAFALRHYRRHLRLNMVTLFGMLIGAALLAAIPLYAASVAGDNLTRSLEEAAAPNSNIEVGPAANGRSVVEEDERFVDQSLADLIIRRVEWRSDVLPLRPSVFNGAGEITRELAEWFYIHAWSITGYEDFVTVVEGRLPTEAIRMATTQTGDPIPVAEVAIGVDAARGADLAVGDLLWVADDRFQAEIVGLIRPSDPNADVWWGDPTLQPFNSRREPGPNFTDNLTVSVIMRQALMDEFVPTERYWRYLIDSNRITVANAQQTEVAIREVNADLTAAGLRMNTGIPDIIDAYQAALARSRVSILLLTLQSLLAVLYTLATLSSFLLDQSRGELATLAGRGYSSWQLTRVYALEALVNGAAALLLGPLLALGLFQIWGRLSNTPVLGYVPLEAWALAAGAILVGWLALIIPIFLSTRRSIVDWIQQRARPPQRPTGRQYFFDLVLLGLGGLAYWQLLQTGSLERGGDVAADALGAADPVLLLGPSLLLFAISLVALRLFPFLLQFISWLSQLVRSFVLPTGFTRLARDPGVASRVLLLISLTVGLILFATIFEHSMTVRQAAIAHYQTGADLRVTLPLLPADAEPDIAAIQAREGVVATAPVYRSIVQYGAGTGSRMPLLALEPDSIISVAGFPPATSSVSMGRIANALRPSDTGLLPLVKTPDARPTDAAVGDVVEYDLGNQTLRFEVRGIILNFPTLDAPYILTNLNLLDQQADLLDFEIVLNSRRELWVETGAAEHKALADELRSQPPPILAATEEASRVAGDAVALLERFQANLIGRQANTAFQLNALVLVILSSMGFLLVQYFSARRRVTEFAVLRALGLSTRQLFGLLALEGVILIAGGTAAGVFIGYLLAAAMRPFLSLTLAASLGGAAIDQLYIPSSTIATLLGGLILFYAAALGLLLLRLSRANIQRVLRLGDE